MSNDISTIEQEVVQLRGEVAQLYKIIRGIAAWPDPWIDLQRACRMKGVSYNTLKQRQSQWKRPRGGVPDKVINGRVMWRPETVREWILLGDEELATRYKTGD